MFWDKGYAPSANIEALLEKENATVEEFLDEEDLLQECKTQKKNIVTYFTRPEIIKRLVELVITEPSEDLPMAQRFRYANMACEILTIGLPSLDEKLLSDPVTLQLLYSYLEKDPPLNPLLSSFYSKTFSMLFTKKAEQDWFLYQQKCLQLLEYLKTRNNFLSLICKHFETPVIPDLIMQMMKDVEGGQLKRNLYEWLTEEKLVERLIAILRNPQEIDKHANVADFFCDLIQQGRSMRQTEQENDSFEPAFEGSNPILKNIESPETIEALLNVILVPNAQESAILSGINVVLTIIKPITFTDEPNSDRQKFLQNRERENHLQLQETVVKVIAPRLHEFVELLNHPPAKPNVQTTMCTLSPPFGKTRLEICRLFTSLLETKHETISKAVCETKYFHLLLDYFKQYCWNNFLHSELEKALHIVFYTHLSNTNNRNSSAASDISFEKHMSNDDYIFNCFMKTDEDEAAKNAKNADKSVQDGAESEEKLSSKSSLIDEQKETKVLCRNEYPEDQSRNNESKMAADSAEIENSEKQQLDIDVAMLELQDENKENVSQALTMGEAKQFDKTKNKNSSPPSEMQIHLIVKCRLISRLIEYWQHNNENQTAEHGCRLGYMGHLIKILKHVTNSITESEHIGALIKSNISDDDELKLWQSIIDPETGDFTKALNTQKKLLANCNPHEESDFNQHMPKDFLGDTSAWDFITRTYNNLGPFSDTNVNDIVFTIDDDQNLYQFGRNIDDDDDDDENAVVGAGDGNDIYTKNSLALSNLVSRGGNPWDRDDPFSDLSTVGTNNPVVSWGADFNSDNFADFDAHFSSFSNDIGLQFPETVGSIELRPTSTEEQNQKMYKDNVCGENKTSIAPMEEYDNNANVEKAKLFKSDKNEAELPSTILGAGNTTSLVSRLQSVLLDGEEDYEDDEGMWTKPLGPTINNQTELQTDVSTDPMPSTLTTKSINSHAEELNIITSKHDEVVAETVPSNTSTDSVESSATTT